MSKEDVIALFDSIGSRVITQFCAYATHLKDTREKVTNCPDNSAMRGCGHNLAMCNALQVENLRIYSTLLLHKLLACEASLHAAVADTELAPTLLGVVTQSTEHEDVFQLSFRMLHTLASSPHRAIQHKLLELRCLALLAPFRSHPEPEIQTLAAGICACLIQAHKKPGPKTT